MLDTLYQAMDNLAANPHMGFQRHDLTDYPVRFWPVHRRYLIIYRDNLPIEIVRVLNSYRNIANLLSDVK
ncbi:MAG: hypothetical protein Tsb005_20790 [Gammaproteobacteria bacterium]